VPVLRSAVDHHQRGRMKMEHSEPAVRRDPVWTGR
jgi:hypothetical protein